ncbi:vWA domain-containing protein [Legionella worsleiensis]|uniref:VWFA domain-containing protein n=1 Tax=Legionella worsleiensis TaxID=45076 RepID=A0A0W1AES4_9GAMM|nr:VWA domain-containing protein [Legionella worsleiensis]KTD79823.1 hypothetical protein Lwor_1337 [Legionella worsleiensis]STY32334.1 TPR (repeat) domain protein [Legionella worsleiensis]
MMADFHFLRPWWLLLIIPLIGLAAILWRQTPQLHAWGEVCDSHLLNHLIQTKRQGRRILSLLSLLASVLFMIISSAGPSWFKLPLPVFKPVEPRVILLDMSDNMMADDLTPNRLSRAKFKLHDLFSRKDVGQFGLIVFTGESFVVSPLTDDGQTISSLLSTLTQDVMPVGGRNLATALNEAGKLIHQAGYQRGEILVLTADTPATIDIDEAKKLAQSGISSSILPVRADQKINPLFQNFANAGNGQLLKYSSNSQDLNDWLSRSGTEEYVLSQDDDIPLWRDEGRWFLIPALLLLLPVFRRGWLQRMAL